MILVAEFGDLTQILTANLAARYHHDLASVAIGAVLGLWAVAGLAIVGGRSLLKVVPLTVITRIAAADHARCSPGSASTTRSRDRLEDGSNEEARMGALVVIVIGVSGSGKSTVGRALADAMAVPFLDGDELHSAADIAKMAAGRPLNDEDRLPWLASLAARVGEMAAATAGSSRARRSSASTATPCSPPRPRSASCSSRSTRTTPGTRVAGASRPFHARRAGGEPVL